MILLAKEKGKGTAEKGKGHREDDIDDLVRRVAIGREQREQRREEAARL